MKRAALWVLAGLGFFMQPNLARAHHTAGHGGGGAGYYNPFSTTSRPPKTFLSFTFLADQLDNNLGQVYRYQLSGEYAVHRRFSVGARLPFLTIRERFLPKNTSIGDVGLVFKELIWHQDAHRQNFTLGQGFSFPTGDRNTGFGSGVVLISPYANYTVGVSRLDFYATLGTTVAAAHEASPTFDYNVGFNIAMLRGKIPLHFFLGLQGSTSFTDDVLANGSSKAFLTPGLIVYWKPQFITTFGARVSVIDTLKVKPGVALLPTSTTLLSDVKAGFEFNVDYFF